MVLCCSDNPAVALLNFASFFGDGSNMVAFQAKAYGKWQACSNGACGLLQQADGAGFPSVKLSRHIALDSLA